MDKLPTQLRWSEFVAALKDLKYRPLKSKRGSARQFERISDGEILTFHEPHGGNPLPTGTLSEYLRKLKISREKLEEALARSSSPVPAQDEERFRRGVDAEGVITSNCMMCYAVVGQSRNEDEVRAAEDAHPCWLPPALELAAVDTD